MSVPWLLVGLLCLGGLASSETLEEVTDSELQKLVAQEQYVIVLFGEKKKRSLTKLKVI